LRVGCHAETVSRRLGNRQTPIARPRRPADERQTILPI
jgi:hypothetical protein